MNLSTQVSQFLGVDWVSTKSVHDAVTDHQNTEFIQNDLRRWYLTVGGEQIENGKGILANCPSEICALMGIDGGYLAKLQNVPSQNDVFEIEISNLNSVSNQVGSLQSTRSAFSAILANQGLNLSRLSFDINNLKEQTDILVTKTKPVLGRSAQKARAAVAAITEEAAGAPSTSPAPGAP